MAKWMHCMIHREALVVRELSPELGDTVDVVTKVINFIKIRSSKSRIFQKLCAEMNAEHRSLLFYCSSRRLLLGKSFERVYELVDELQAFLQRKKKNLADCLAENKFLLKLAYFCDIFAKLNKMNISMYGPNKNMLDISNKIAVFIKKLSLSKKDIENVSGSSQCFTFCPVFWKKSMMLPSNLRSVFLQHLSNLELKFKKYFPENLSSYEWICDPFAQPTPSSFIEQEKEDYLNLNGDNSLKKEV